MIELDQTPTDKELDEIKKERSKTTEDTPVVKPLSNDDTAQHDVIKPTAQPHRRAPRRDPSYKPSVWDSKQHRTEYMREWRAQGRDVETGNKYIKKNKD